jgi:hypothetical protein
MPRLLPAFSNNLAGQPSYVTFNTHWTVLPTSIVCPIPPDPTYIIFPDPAYLPHHPPPRGPHLNDVALFAGDPTLPRHDTFRSFYMRISSTWSPNATGWYLGIRAEVIFGSVRYVRYCTKFLLGTRYGIRYKEGLATSILNMMFGTRGKECSICRTV